MDENALLVLVVEDNPDDEHVTLRGLRRCDVSVTTRVAHDGEEALDILGLAGGEPWTPHLVLSDLKMPRVRGDELLERCRVDPRLADVPFVVMSSSAERQDVERCLTLGASEYAVKPVGYDEYLESVCALAKRWLVKG